ncbi:hypothetical protein ES705_23026 [subsurface metagenome]
MRKAKYTALWILGMVIAGFAFNACEIDEPFPDPSGDFEIWGTNPETNAYEQIPEPFQLIAGIPHDFIVEGTGQQFVFWFGTPGDPESSTPKGSDFNDRGKNHQSKGRVAVNNTVKFPYPDEGVFEIVLVASSYSYSTDEYKESILKKSVTVVAP